MTTAPGLTQSLFTISALVKNIFPTKVIKIKTIIPMSKMTTMVDHLPTATTRISAERQTEGRSVVLDFVPMTSNLVAFGVLAALSQ